MVTEIAEPNNYYTDNPNPSHCLAVIKPGLDKLENAELLTDFSYFSNTIFFVCLNSPAHFTQDSLIKQKHTLSKPVIVI